jgi:16S rRNA (uracil1498-N3)-methyltransferase
VIASRGAVERWRRVAVSSAKQCRRATVPAVTAARHFDDWLRTADDEWRLMLVEPAAAHGNEAHMRAFAARPRPASAALVVGPEGGWSAEERGRAAAAGCTLVSLGALTLRADAVPIAAIAVLRFALEDL